jgi:serine/threonine-protein kinase
VILRCLEPDPALRPASALAVAAALPGGDPLAAALAAGETPSPDMVAAAGDVGGLSPKIALACLAIVVLGAIPLPWMSWQAGLMRFVNLEKSTAVLADHANDILKNLGYTDRPRESAVGYIVDEAHLRFIASTDSSPTRWQALAGSRPPVFSFWYRSSSTPMVPLTAGSARITREDPPLMTQGMRLVETGPDGLLTRLVAVPPQEEELRPQPATPDWSHVFKEAGLDITTFSPAPSRRTPPVYADTRAAWTGIATGRSRTPIRIEAAAVNGTPVFFEIVPPWPNSETSGPDPRSAVALVMAFVAYSSTLLLAWHNLRRGRGDRRGAFRLGVWYGAGLLAARALESHSLAALVATLPQTV